MSKENRPYLNAAGLSTDIYTAINNRLRGRAKIPPEVIDYIADFVEVVNDAIEEASNGNAE